MTHQVTEKTRKQVEAASAIGIPQVDIARLLDITDKTLREHYRDELDNGGTKANINVGGALYSKATGGDTTAMIWWTKARMRWSEKKQLEHSGEIDGEITSRVVFEFTDEVDDEDEPEQEAH